MNKIKAWVYWRLTGKPIYKWYATAGDETLRIEYRLNESSLVWDVGAYHGDWASDIAERYKCKVTAFEAVPEYVDLIKKRFSGNRLIDVKPFGLSDADGILRLHLDGVASSAFKIGDGVLVDCQLRDVRKILSEISGDVDLIKINIEGGEFPLLESLLCSGLIERFKYIQVQFHSFAPNSHARRQAIREALSRSHSEMWNFDWVWESWQRRT